MKLKKIAFWLLVSLLACYLWAGKGEFGLIGLGTPENSSRYLDGFNGEGSYCEPPGSLCHEAV